MKIPCVLGAVLWAAGLMCALPPAAAAPDVPPAYRVGPGDVLNIMVWGFDDLTKDVVVTESSSFSFPLVNSVDCLDLTTPEIETRLRDLLADGYVKNPQVTVRVIEYHSRKVNVFGEVMKPGTYALQGPTTLIEVLSMAGGAAAKAGSRVVLLRNGQAALAPAAGEERVPLTFRLEDLVGGMTSTPPIYLEGGDTVFVPESDFFFVLGEVQSPGMFKIEGRITVLQAVTMAGGFTPKASTRKIKVIRDANGTNVEKRVPHDALVQAQDTIVVPESFF